MSRVIETFDGGRLRLLGRGELLAGEVDAPPDRVVIEWAGRVGHPSSYGLLGASPTDRPTEATIELAHEGSRFDAALTGTSDEVTFGLPQEYRSAVLAASSVFTFPMVVRVGAHATVGSSARVFEQLTDLLAFVIYLTDAERTDEVMLLQWRRAWTARDWIHDVSLPDTYRDLRGTTRVILDERDRFKAEIRREVGSGHRLFGATFTVLARDTARDDVLIFVQPNRVALVHLTYVMASPDRTPWPITVFVLDENHLREQWTLRT